MYSVLMPNPNPKTEHLRNYRAQTGPTTEAGKFKVSLNAWKGGDHSPTNEYMNRIPKDVKEVYTWFKKLKITEFEYLFDMKGIYEGLKGNTQLNEDIQRKLMTGEKLSSDERDQFRLLVEILEKLQKLEHGEKRLNINADLKDIRDAMFPDDNTRNK